MLLFSPHPNWSTAKNLVVPGAKRGRQLIRQSRIKKDIDPSQMPQSPDDIDYETSSSPYSQRLSTSSSVSTKMERHVSDPSPRLSSQSPPLSSAMHLLTVPHAPHAPILTKQHSAPNQSICDTQFYYHRQESHSHFPLHRQLSLPSSHSPPPERTDPFSIAEEKESLAASGPSHSSVRPSVSTSLSAPEPKLAHDLSPTFIVSEPTDQAPPMRIRSEELQRSVSSPQVCCLILFHLLLCFYPNENKMIAFCYSICCERFHWRIVRSIVQLYDRDPR